LIKRITAMKTTSALPHLLVFSSPLISRELLERKTVLKKRRFVLFSFAVMALGSIMAGAQAPVVGIDPQQHGELAQAQSNLVQAYSDVVQAQRNNLSHLGGHAQRAKDLISQANEELRLAADRADANERRLSPDATSAQPSPTALTVSAAPVVTPDVSGDWTIYAYSVTRPGSSLKTVHLVQQGNILTGAFHGPNQHGKLQGWISGNEIEFSTDTRNILTFHGSVIGSSMSGMWGFDGLQARWKAERTQP
jgi:hypothetical protein